MNSNDDLKDLREQLRQKENENNKKLEESESIKQLYDSAKTSFASIIGESIQKANDGMGEDFFSFSVTLEHTGDITIMAKETAKNYICPSLEVYIKCIDRQYPKPNRPFMVAIARTGKSTSELSKNALIFTCIENNRSFEWKVYQPSFSTESPDDKLSSSLALDTFINDCVDCGTPINEATNTLFNIFMKGLIAVEDLIVELEKR